MTRIFSAPIVMSIVLAFAPCSGAVDPSLVLEAVPTKAVFPGQEFDLLLSYKDSQGFLVKDFVSSHQKLNHTVIVSKDLETFVHVHPEQKKEGHFIITLNSAKSADPDNLDAHAAVPKPGTYFIFSELVMKGDSGVTLATDTLLAHGKTNEVPLELDPFTDGKSTKHFRANGDPGSYSDTYRVTLTVNPMAGMVHFYFKIETWKVHGGKGHYMAVENFQEWLGMAGHGILIGKAGDDPASKIFRHLHANAPDVAGDGHHGHHSSGMGAASGELEMALMGNDVPPAGIYKLWGQFKIENKVITFPFILEF